MESKKTSTTWKKGDPSPNPAGRMKMRNSARTVKGMIERFVKRNITPNKLQTLYDGLTANNKLQFLLELLPYFTAKQSSLSIHTTFDQLNDADLNKLYDQVMGTIEEPESIKINKDVTLLPAKYNRYGQE